MRKIFLSLLILAICASAGLWGCAGKSREAASPPAAPPCRQMRVVLPGNYIVDVAAGSQVMVNPTMQEFVLFCSKEEASQALRQEIAAGRLNEEGDWRVYLLEGDPADIAENCGPTRYCLKKSARVVDWED